MKLFADKQLQYECENIIRLFIPEAGIVKCDTGEFGESTLDDDYVFVGIDPAAKDAEKAFSEVKVKVCLDGKYYSRSVSSDESFGDAPEEIAAATLIYEIFSEVFGFAPRWGILTGVRPAKLFARKTEELGSEKAAAEYFSKVLLVSKEKTALAADTVSSQDKAAGYSSPDSYSLYVSIPFCPSRCSYCSFVSHSVEKTAAMVEPYVGLLIKELEKTAEIARENSLKLKTIYFGGGTPTQLSADQLDRLLCAVEENFELSGLLEYTVEAGRPDTVTEEKLEVLKKHSVTRISINPQTMHNSVLEKIGRRHTSEDMLDAFYLARKCGFDNINTDLIAGLPHDDVKGFCSSLDKIIELAPENITVHTLSLKRSSRLVTSNAAEYKALSTSVNEMLGYAANRLYKAGYSPYYLYRQSKTVGNMENVGWSKEGFDCLYNIYMMNELHTVLSAGAGAVTRLKAPHSSEIERIFNFKYPYEYISRFDEIIERKQGVTAFYEKYGI